VLAAIHDRVLLLRPLAAAGPLLVTLFATVLLIESLLPAASAVTMALVIGRAQHTAVAGVFGAILAPLIAFAAVLFVGHTVEAANKPLDFLLRARIDGAHRADVARLAASSPTIAPLEHPETQRLIRVARADPDNWTERTPAAGAIAQLGLIANLIGLAASCAVLARYAWWLVPLLVLPAYVAHMLRTRKIRGGAERWLAGAGASRQTEVWGKAVLDPGKAKDVRIFGLGNWIVDRVERGLLDMFEPLWARILRDARTVWIEGLLVGTPLVIAFTTVAAGAAHGHSSVAVETAVFGAAWSVFAAMNYRDSVRDIVGARECLAAYRELRVRLATDSSASTTAAASSAATSSATAPLTTAPPAPSLIRFENVGFNYPGTERTVLDNVDLEIRPGELLAIVGLNGAGKSTLIKLLSGLYNPTAGRITADGTDIAELGVDVWRDRISVVFQDFVRYHLSAADNVALGRGAYPRDQAAIDAAAREAGFDAVLERLPDGWDTKLSRSRSGGVDLSGGQWQQVVLARALYAVQQGATLLVLDEPTAHLDVRTEFEVFKRLAERRGTASVVLISHRLSTVRYADRIVLLDGGRITESGTHDELIALGGGYAELFAIQAERFNRGYDDRIEEGELL
jgi:ABC-type multidrug transport system fused ATPase/permease subunit